MALREEILQGFKESIDESLSTILAMMPTVTEKADVNISGGGNIVISLSFAGKLEGTIFLVLSEDAARKIIAKMLGCQPSEVSAECYDGTGELVNIIAGGIKTRLEPSGYDFALSIPSMVKGDCQLSIASLGKAEKIGLLVAFPDINFEIVMFYLVNSTGAKSAYQAMRDHKAQEAENKLREFLDKK